MKNIAKIIAAGSVLFALAACSHVAKYTTDDFVAVAATSYTVVESTTTLVVPVCAYPANGESNTTVSFDVKDGSAVAGTDYTFAPANGVLNFSGDKAQSITITIIGHQGEFTGDRKFTIELKDATNNYELSPLNKVSVTIKDEDHPLTSLFGNYDLVGISYYKSDGYYQVGIPMTISPYEGDVTRVWMKGFVAFNRQDWYSGYFTDSSVYGIVSSDMKTITIPVPQGTPSKASIFGYDDEYFTMYKYDTTYKWEDEESASGRFINGNETIVFSLDEESGVYVTTDAYGFTVPSEAAAGKPLYDDLVMYSDKYTGYATYFVRSDD